MNRRAFLTGLLASTAAVPIVRAALLTLGGVQLVFDDPRGKVIYFANREFWIAGPNVIRFSEILDKALFE